MQVERKEIITEYKPLNLTTMTKKERELIADLASYATTHQHESVYLVEIAYALWRIKDDQADLAQIKYLLK